VKVTILGSGTCAVTKERSCAGYAIQTRETSFLLDCGFGTLRRMAETDIDYKKIDAVVISHHHLDHVGDLMPLLMALRWTPGFKRQKPLTLIGPQGFRSFMEHSQGLYGESLFPVDQYNIEIMEISTESITIGDCQITAFPVFHSGHSNGYQVKHQNKVLAYSGDTGPGDHLVTVLKNADVALVECAFPDEQQFEFHLTPTVAAQYARHADVDTLVLTHFYPMMEGVDVVGIAGEHFFGKIVKAEDKMTFDL